MSIFATTTSLQLRMVGTNFDAATTLLGTACIEDAENEIRKRLSSTYDFTTAYFTDPVLTPPMIETLCLQLAEGYMYECMARGGKDAFARSDRFIKRVFDNLDKIADGTFQLLDVNGLQITATKTKWQVRSTTDQYATTFNEDQPRRWRVDSQKLQDIADERGNPGDTNELD